MNEWCVWDIGDGGVLRESTKSTVTANQGRPTKQQVLYKLSEMDM